MHFNMLGGDDAAAADDDDDGDGDNFKISTKRAHEL